VCFLKESVSSSTKNVLNLTRMFRVTNEEIRRRTDTSAEQARRLKFQWAGHLMGIQVDQKSNRMETEGW
jgi:hypothetical protein